MLKTARWPLSKLKPYKLNAKKHPPAQVQKLADIITKHGFDVPIVVDGDGVIIKGHGRFAAAKKAGLKEVPVIIRDDLTPAQIREARISDNKVAEMGEWDVAVLGEDVKDALEKFGKDFDETLAGLKMSDVGEHKRVVKDATAVPSELRYSVIVDFKNEQDQEQFLNAQEKKGHACRLLIS